MENLQPGEVSGSSGDAGESSESTFQLNIMTVDSQISSFLVDKNILVSAFKEKIARQLGVPVGRQRLIFRGRVLKDEHLLSEHNVEHGHTLHLVESQPQSPPDGPQLHPPQEQVISRNSDPQVDLQNAAGRARTLTPEETLFNLVNATVLPSTRAEVFLMNAICTTSEHALVFMQEVLADLTRRVREERRD